jgi:hypothetical protein
MGLAVQVNSPQRLMAPLMMMMMMMMSIIIIITNYLKKNTEK